MKNTKLIMIATEEVVFPYECGKLRVTEESDIIAIQRAVEAGEKIVLVPVKVGEKANLCVFDLEKEYTINSAEFLSMGKATPFEGHRVFGRCILTVYEGKTVYSEI